MKNLFPYLLITTSLAIMLVGCYTGKKAEKQVIKAQTSYPEKVAGLCSDMYPPITLVKDSVIYKSGEQKMLDTFFMSIDCDTVYEQAMAGKVVKVPCPKVLMQTDTVFITKETQVVNKAEVKKLTSKARSLELALGSKKNSYNILLNITIVLVAYTVVRWLLLSVWKIRIP